MSRDNSMVGWVDFSSLERERVSQVLSMLQEKGTLDELGIGQIRDAFADKLFPGFSTIQTRAKYFATLPYIFHDYRQIELHERRNLSLVEFISRREDELARSLVSNHAGAIPNGIIGKESLDKGVSRKPSSVYWNGLRQLAIANTDLSLKEFISQFEQQVNTTQDSHEDDDNQASNIAHWMTKPADYSSSWIESAKIELNRKEAEFLKDKLLLSNKIEHSIPAQLVKHNLVDESLKVADALSSSAWQVEALYEQLKGSSISVQTKICLEKALEFSFVLEGAHIRYNLLIADRANNITLHQQLVEEFQGWFEESKKYPQRFEQKSINEWYLCAFGMEKSTSSRTRQFIENWCRLMGNNATEEQLDECVKRQAIANKGARCLLKKALSTEQKWVGMRKLEFRWPTAKTILQDIQEGLNVKA